MAITKEKKKEIISKIKDAVSDSKSVAFVNFNGLTVLDASSLRRALKKDGVNYFVTKKSLFKRVLNDFSFKGDIPTLDGELAIAFLSKENLANSKNIDLISPARGIYEFQKKLEGKVSLIGGIFDGEYKSKEDMVSIASIPSLQVLRGMFVNIINSPIQRFAVAMGQIAEKKN